MTDKQDERMLRMTFDEWQWLIGLRFYLPDVVKHVPHWDELSLVPDVAALEKELSELDASRIKSIQWWKEQNDELRSKLDATVSENEDLRSGMKRLQDGKGCEECQEIFNSEIKRLQGELERTKAMIRETVRCPRCNTLVFIEPSSPTPKAKPEVK